jgi:hypothetical protein
MFHNIIEQCAFVHVGLVNLIMECSNLVQKDSHLIMLFYVSSSCWSQVLHRSQDTLTCHNLVGSPYSSHVVATILYEPMIGENSQLVTNELVEVQDWRKMTDHCRGIYKIYPNLVKENRRMSTCNRLDLQTLGSQPIKSKNLPDHWYELQ